MTTDDHRRSGASAPLRSTSGPGNRSWLLARLDDRYTPRLVIAPFLLVFGVLGLCTASVSPHDREPIDGDRGLIGLDNDVTQVADANSRHVAPPAVRPQAAVLGVFTLMAAWNDFLRPLIVLDPNDSPTVQVALSALDGGHYTDHSLVLAGAPPAVPPVVAISILLSRRIVGGIVQGASKG